MNVKPDFAMWAAMIKEFEGLKLAAYQDTGGVWTCGFGTTFLHDKDRRVKQGDTFTYEQAISYMQFEFAEVVRLANVYIKKDLLPYQSVAVCDYIYNRGIGNFLKTSFNGWGFDELLNIEPYDLRIPQIIENTGLKDRLGNLLNGLIRRRKSQAHLYKTGQLKFKF